MNYDILIEKIILARGEEKTDETVEKIKAYYKVEHLSELTEVQMQSVYDKMDSEKKPKSSCANCGREMNKKGLFYICTKCKKVKPI